jgi:hypothetical protein
MNCHLDGTISEYQGGRLLNLVSALILAATLLLTALFPGEAYAAPEKKPDEKSEKFIKELQTRFNRFPQLRQYGFRVKVLSYSEGILTLTTSKLPETKSAAMKKNLKSIWKKLIGISERLAKSYPAVKTVIWIDQKEMVAPTVAPMTPTEPAKKKKSEVAKKETKKAEKNKTEKPMTNFSAVLGIRNMSNDYWKSPTLNRQNFLGIAVDHEEKRWKAGVLLELTYSTATKSEGGIDYKNYVTAVDVGGRKSWYLKDILIPSLSAGASIIQIKDEGFKGGTSQGKIIEFYYGYFIGTSFLLHFEGFSLGVTGKQVAGTKDGLGNYTQYGAVFAWGF